jgi:small subunit ribosomal protein S17
MAKTKRYLIHDPENRCKIGESVLVQEHPPVSAKKRWILKTVLN